MLPMFASTCSSEVAANIGLLIFVNIWRIDSRWQNCFFAPICATEAGANIGVVSICAKPWCKYLSVNMCENNWRNDQLEVATYIQKAEVPGV